MPYKDNLYWADWWKFWNIFYQQMENVYQMALGRYGV